MRLGVGMGVAETRPADAYQDSVRKVRQAGGKGTFLLLSPE